MQTNMQSEGERKGSKARGEFNRVGALFGVGVEYNVELNKKVSLIPEVGFTAKCFCSCKWTLNFVTFK
jgi:hypothetical protein